MKEEFSKSWKRYLDDCILFWKYPWEGMNLLQKPTPPKKNLLCNTSKKNTIFRHPYKKRKSLKHRRYQRQTNRHPIVTPLQKATVENLYKIHPLHSIT